ncbi:MAG TPA: YihY/virulence factor BrkB family protein [Methylomirabilota bacterium]|nr:YihY/virulence factor BrkB family protein [Methylomirabilota bacterium]
MAEKAAPPSPWNLGGLSVRELARRVYNEITADEVLDRAASLAYYLVFALFPTLLFLTSLLGLLPLPNLMDRLFQYADHALPSDAASMLRRTFAEIQRNAHGGLLSAGALAALWASSSGMDSMISALNVAYDVQERRPWWKRRLIALALTVGFGLFILVALVLLVFGGQIGALVAAHLGLGGVFTVAWNVASVLIVITCVLVGLAMVYYLAPDAKQHWWWVTPGSAVALLVWLGISFGLRFYVSHFTNYSATYGSIGGVILLILWLYLSGVVLLLGAEINAEIEHAAAERGAVTAKARGENEAPADGGTPEAVLAARRAAPPPKRARWRRTLALVGAGAVVGWVARRQRAA